MTFSGLSEALPPLTLTRALPWTRWWARMVPRPPAVFGLLWLHHCQVASDAPVMGKQINFTCTYSLTWPPQSISSCENVCISQPINFRGLCWELAPSIQTTSVVSLLCQTGTSKTLKPILISTL